MRVDRTELRAPEHQEPEKSGKFRSRKFAVWAAATLFEAVFCAFGFAVQDTGLAQDFIPWWGGISMIYIGGNVAQKFAAGSPEHGIPQAGEPEAAL